MKIQALLFDFDGTLADSFPAITASTNYVRSQAGLPLLSEAKVREYVGHGLKHLLERLAPGVPPQHAIEQYRTHHETVMFTHTRLFPGVQETLATLQAQGRKLAVCSNKSVQFTRRLVDGFNLARFLPVVLGPEDVSAPKPDPAMLLEALRRLEVSKPNAIYVGDMAIDIQTSRNAGLPVWLMPNGAHGIRDATATNPDRLLRDFSEILELVN